MIIRLTTLFLCVFASIVAIAKEDPEDFSSRIYLGAMPSISPDGRFFVFEWCYRIWRAPVAGGEAIALGDGSAHDTSPFLSPDGTRVAFLSNRDGDRKLFELGLADSGSLAAGELRQATFHSEGLTPKGYVSDGTHMLAVIKRDHAPDPKSVLHGFSRAALLPLGKRGSEKILFDAPALDPALSPDGGKLLFIPRSESIHPTYRKRTPPSFPPGGGQIWLYDLNSKVFTSIINRKEDVRSPIWTADGEGFYFLLEEGGCRNVFHHSLKTGEQRRITSFKDEHVFAPTLSKDGKTMIVRQGFDFWRFDPTAKNVNPERIILRASGAAPTAERTRRRWYTTVWNNDGGGSVTFANEGNEVAFTTGGDLWVMDSTFRQPVCVHGSSRTHERDCAFSPDGSVLYYLSDRGDGVDVWKAVRADSSKAWWENTEFVRTRLTNDDNLRIGFSVSPDGTRLAWLNRTGKIFFAGTNAVVSAVSPVKASGCPMYDWSPDSRWVVASINDAYGNADVWIVPAFTKDEDGSDAPKPYNLSRNYRVDEWPTWSSDGKIIAFAGRRAKSSDNLTVFYVYLDPADESAEDPAEATVKKAKDITVVKKSSGKNQKGVKADDRKKNPEADRKNDLKENGDGKAKDKKKPDDGKKKVKIVFDSLFERVRMTRVQGSRLHFGHDPRKLAYEGNDGVYSVTIPTDMKPKKILSKKGRIVSCIKTEKGERFLRIINNVPAHDDSTLDFKAYQVTKVADYQELAFLSAWGIIRDRFCDPNLHGADWPAVKKKYTPAARNAPCWSVFNRVVQMMLGELDASHQGFYESDSSKKEWNVSVNRHGWDVSTAHFGARYNPDHSGDGWLVKSVVKGSPCDRGKDGLLPGDIVLRVDGKKVVSGMDVTEVMNVPRQHIFKIDYSRNGTNGVLFAKGCTYNEIRSLMRSECVLATRRHVGDRGNFGYINIKAMDKQSLDDFMDNVFAEGFGKDGIIVDVRYNGGGYVADKILDVLCGPVHSRSMYRGDAGEGYLMSYWGRPLLPSLPLVVLCNWCSSSNAEIFSHAVKTLKRGKLVGVQTGGKVIATRDIPLLDMGTIRCSHIGWFTADGTDMEHNGAMPDCVIDISPEDVAQSRDPQLDEAIRVLKEESASPVNRPELKYVK